MRSFKELRLALSAILGSSKAMLYAVVLIASTA